MHIPSNKKVVCITGSVWTGSRVAPRRMLVKDGFLRPTWFTTGRPLTDAEYRHVSVAQFHLTNAEKNVLAHIEYAGGVVGVMREDFESAMVNAEKGVDAEIDLAAFQACTWDKYKSDEVKEFDVKSWAKTQAKKIDGECELSTAINELKAAYAARHADAVTTVPVVEVNRTNDWNQAEIDKGLKAFDTAAA